MGLDLAKSIFRAHGVDATGRFVGRKSLRQSQMLRCFAKLPCCLVGIGHVASLDARADEAQP